MNLLTPEKPAQIGKNMKYILLEARDSSGLRMTALVSEDEFEGNEIRDFFLSNTKEHRKVGEVDIEGDYDVLSMMHESYTS